MLFALEIIAIAVASVSIMVCLFAMWAILTWGTSE